VDVEEHIFWGGGFVGWGAQAIELCLAVARKLE